MGEKDNGFLKAGVNEASAVSPNDMILSPIKAVHAKGCQKKKGSAGSSAAPADQWRKDKRV